MKAPPKNHTHLWNGMPLGERKRLMPYEMESQLLNIWQCKQKAIAAHRKHIKDLDDWMANIKRDLDKVN